MRTNRAGGYGSLMLLAVLTVASAGQATDVVGFVKERLGKKPIDGATVTLVSDKGTRINGQLTNLTGAYQFLNVPDDKYTVVVDATGYNPRPSNVVRATVAGANTKPPDDVLLWPN